MTRSKVPRLGTAFLVPLRDRGYAVGVLARADGRGSAFGYFFGPRVTTASDVSLDALMPDRALLVGMFGDLGLITGEWPMVGMLANWKREEWPMPPLARIDGVAGRAWLCTYDGDSLRRVKSVEVDPGAASRFPREALMGAGSVEVRLTKLLADPAAG